MRWHLCLFLGLFLLSTPLLLSAQENGKIKERKKMEQLLDDEGLVIQPSSAKVKYPYRPLTLSLDEEGKQYVRFLIWHQQWMLSQNLNDPNRSFEVNHMVRRSRFLVYAQLHPDFLILTHWGLNNLTQYNMSALGNDGDGPQLFLHDAWTEFRISDKLFIGGGLHYFRGLTRLSSQSTLNFMTMDLPRPFTQWHSLGITDQFVRHIGVYIKGDIGRLAYRISADNPMRNPLNGGLHQGDFPSVWAYSGANNTRVSGEYVGNTLVEGYFAWYFQDQESTKLPFWVGSYLGTKNIFNIGTGFFYHPNGMFNTDTQKHAHVFHWAADVFWDRPLQGIGALSLYSSFIRFNYADGFVSRWAGTGQNLYTQVGIYAKKWHTMPYFSFQMGDYEGLNNTMYAGSLGFNYYLMDNHAKLSAEYHFVSNFGPEGGRTLDGTPLELRQFRVQAHIFF